MKKLNYLLVLLLIGGLAFLISCDDDEEDPTFTLSSLTANGTDLAGVSQAVDIPEDAVIEAVFSSEVDASTATSSNFEITKTNDGSPASYSVSASGNKVTITPTDQWDGGTQYTIDLKTGITGTNGVSYAGNVLSFRTGGIFVPQAENQVLFLSFDDATAEDEAGEHIVSTVETLTFTDDRRGTPEAAAYFDGEGNLIEIQDDDDLISPSITVSFWFRTELADYDGGDGTGQPQTRFVMGIDAEKGYFLEMGRRSKDPAAAGFNEIFLKYGSNHVNIGNNAASVPEATHWTEINSQLNVNYEADVQSGWSFAVDQLQSTNDPLNHDFVREEVMGEWTHLVMTFDAPSQTKTIYVNGVKWASFTWISSGADWLFSDLSLKTENNDGTPMEGVTGVLTFGNACSSDNTSTGWCNYETLLGNPPETMKFFKGGIDQIRIFSLALTEQEVQTLYTNEE